MNRNLYRLVFNPARGMTVAVRESASGRCKNGSARQGACGGRGLVAALWLTGLTAAAAGVPLQAQTLPIQVDTAAAGPRPYVGTAANGTPVINIAPPNRAGGTSINNFTQYNVGQPGVVINNSGQASQTRLAGWVQGNMQLGNQYAGTIVQQVTAPNPSQLLGMQEIAGHRASLVVVNPAGITCAGCGTIQADRFTLSTGRALYGTDGSLTAFGVNGGRIAIDGEGLASPQAQVELLARSIAVNAALWTDSLNIVAGANRVQYADLATMALTGAADGGDTPAFAIDASTLGAMHGGAVRLVGTEKGLGFNLGGTIASSSGDIVLDANGDVRIVAGARVQAAGNTTISGANVDNAGAVNTQGRLQAVAAGGLSNTGTLAAGHDVLVRADRIVNHGTVGAGLDADARVTQAGQIDLVAADRIESDGSMLAGANARLAARALNLQGGTVVAQETATLSATEDIDHRHSHLEARDVNIAAGGAFDNTGGRAAATGNVGISSGALTNHLGTISGAGGISLATATLDNRQGVLVAGGALSVAANALRNTGGQLGTTGDATLRIGSTLDNTAGFMHAAGRLDVEADRVINQHTLDGTEAAPLGMEGGWLQVVADVVDNAGGALRAGSGLAVAGMRLDNTGGEITADGVVEVEVADTTNTRGLIASNEVVAVAGRHLSGDGKVRSRKDVSIALIDDFTNTGVLSAGRDLSLRTGGDVVNAGTIAAGGALDIESGASIHNAGLIDGGTVRLEAESTVTNVDRIFGDSVAIGAGERIVNDADDATGNGGVIASRTGDIHLGAAKIVNREHALIYSSRDLHVGGELDWEGNATGQARSLTNASALIDVAGDANISAAIASNLNNHFSTTRVDGGSSSLLTYRLNGSTEDIPADSVVFYHVNNGSWAPGSRPEFMGEDDYVMLVLPSATYPFETFGPPFDWSRNPDGQPGIGGYRAGMSRPVGLAYYPVTHGGSGYGRNLPETFVYGPDDAIWSNFGLPRPEAPPPRPTPCGIGGQPACQPGAAEEMAAYEAWYAANKPAYLALNDRIRAFNADFNARVVKEFYIQRTTTRRQEEVVATTDPGRILVGGNAVLDGQLINDKSQILVGGKLATAAPVGNFDHDATRIDTITGTRQWTRVKKGGFGKGDKRVYDTYTLDPVAIPVPVKLAAAHTEHELGTIARSGNAPGQTAGPVGGVPELRELPGQLKDSTIRQVTPALAMPDNALFHLNPAPEQHYLIETDPRFTDQHAWMSSDYMLTRLGQDPQRVLKRLGDGFYEARLVADAVMLATGQRFVGDYTDNSAQYMALMEAGIGFAEKFQLGIGTELSAAQMAQLTADMVWLVEKAVTLPDGSTRQVLVPQVYLVSRVGELKADGALIAANTVAIETSGDVTNTGTISGRTLAFVGAKNIRNDGGVLRGGALALKADQDIDNVAGTLRGNTVIAEAGRDIKLTSTTATGVSASGSSTQLAGVASVIAENATLVAGRDIDVTAASIETTGDLGLSAERDLRLGAVTVEQVERGEIDARNRYGLSRGAQVGSRIQTGGNTVMVAGQDVIATAADVSAGGALGIDAGRDIHIRAGKAVASVRDEHYTKSSGLLSSSSTHTIDASSRTEALGSTFSAETLAMNAGRDLEVAGSTVAGTGDVSLAAIRNLDITTTETTSSAHSYRREKKTGFGATGGGISYGKREQKDTVNDSAVTQAGSLVGSTDGSVNLRAGSTLTVRGSNLIATQDVTGIGADVRIEAARNRQHHDETHEFKQTGFTLGVSGGAIGSAINAGQKISSASKSQDGRASALWGIAAGRDAYDAAMGAGDAMKSLADGKGPAGTAVTLSFGTSKSKSTFTQDRTTHTGSKVQAGGTATFIATGVDADGNKTAGNLDII
ncbi:hemagglutinin repeat-containing protein, partial [Cupriavidus sp. D384]|uniref:two-partner secretion domain-containing protein n=1 Tax=Cupriavidus sp. D384 TaxID=1538095 RepID=UPI0012E7BAAA